MFEYNLERMASHGIRRADEMEQSAITLTELGVEPLMTTGTVARQRALGELGKQDAMRAAKTKAATRCSMRSTPQHRSTEAAGYAGSTDLSLLARSARRNGFCNKCTPSSRRPSWTIEDRFE